MAAQMDVRVAVGLSEIPLADGIKIEAVKLAAMSTAPQRQIRGKSWRVWAEIVPE